MLSVRVPSVVCSRAPRTCGAKRHQKSGALPNRPSVGSIRILNGNRAFTRGLRKDCQCHVGPPIGPGFSGHEFSPVDEKGIFVRRPCARPGVWRGFWQCGGCPDTHVALVCDECRAHHDADSTAADGAKLMWIRVQD